MKPTTLPPESTTAVVDSVDATVIGEGLRQVRARELDTSLIVTATHDGATSLHIRLHAPGKRRPEVDLFICTIAGLGPGDLDAEESAEILAAVETVLPQLQALRDRLAEGSRA